MKRMLTKSSLNVAILVAAFLVASEAANTQQLAPGGAFRIPPAGTVATYQCNGGKAGIMTYAIEAVEGDTLTVKVKGDGEDFGIYQRKVWQTFGTSLYESVTYRGVSYEGDKKVSLLADVGKLEPQRTFKANHIELPMIVPLAATPLNSSEIAAQTGFGSHGSGSVLLVHNLEIVIGERRLVSTNGFGQQSVVNVVEKRLMNEFQMNTGLWTSQLWTDFAPTLGFPLHQTYKDKVLKNVTCELTTISGPSANYITMGPVTPRTNKSVVPKAPARSNQVASPLKFTDTTPPVIEVVSGLISNLEVETISGRVMSGSNIVSLTIEGTPVAIGADGAFSAERELPIGKSQLRIAAIDTRGNHSEVIVSVLRKPQIPKLNYGKYYALVIGNNSYSDFPKLRTAVADAEAIAKTLSENYGFDVNLLLNATREDIIDSLFALRSKLKETDNLIIYYAGHGSLDENVDRGYWIPVNARLDRRSRWVSNADITDAIRGLRAKHVLVIADSCYSGKISRSAKSVDNSTGYISRMVEKSARVVMTSGGLEPVVDSGGGDHSVFASKLLSALSENEGVMVGTELFQKVLRRVVLNAEQTPQYSEIRFAGHDGGGDFVFVRKY